MNTIKTFIISLLVMFSMNLAAQLKVDSNGNTTVKYGSFTSGNDGVLFLGNTEHYIKSVFGYGVKIGTSGMTDWIRLKAYTGGVGINRDPQYALDVNGNIRANTTLYTSDIRFKTNIEDLDNPINKIKLIQGISYNFLNIDSLTQRYNTQSSINKNFGFIAQDFQKVYPELVYEDSMGYLSIDYISLIPVLLEALKKQQDKIDGLAGRIETMEENCCNYDLKSASLTTSTTLADNEAILYQNTPNPFSSQTTIRFEIPETVQKAQLLLCDMNGSLLKTIGVNQRGAGNILISANELTAGIYLYTLIADGREIATKRMILTE